MANLHKKVLKAASPGSTLLDVAGVSRSNTLRQVANPGAMVATNVSEGKPLTVSSATDPAGFFKKPEPTPPPPVVPMPDQEEIQRQRRRRAALTQRTGRASTILTNNGDQLGP